MISNRKGYVSIEYLVNLGLTSLDLQLPNASLSYQKLHGQVLDLHMQEP